MLGGMSALDRSRPEDAAARVCAWANHLEEAGRTADARDVLRAALDRHGDVAQIMVRLAELERDDDHPVQAIEILAKALSEHPGDVEAGRALAGLLFVEGRTTEAAATIDGLPEFASGQLGELAGRIYRALGQHAKAVHAFSRCESLSRSGRRLRRRSWWRSGGPFGRVSPIRAPAPPVQEPVEIPETSDELMELVTWAECLSGQDRANEARQVLTDALAQHGRHPRLLRCLAELEDSDGAGQTALYLWCEAYRVCPSDVGIVCHLVGQLADTTVPPSYTRRIQDALRILDAFPDPSHPEIRSARAYVLYRGEATSARVAAAFGRAKGLSAEDAVRRRRFWLRSAGPFGRLCVRLVDLARGPQTLPAAALMPACAESENVARFLDSLRDQPVPAAKRRLQDAWQQYGRLPSLLLAYADVDGQTRYGWTGLLLTAEAARTDPDNLAAICSLADDLDTAEDYAAASRLLKSLPPPAQQTTEVRVTLGDIHRYAGNHALASAAYGDPRDLNRIDRRSRRRSLRRGLWQRRWIRFRDDGPPLDLDAFSPASFAAAEAIDQADARLDPGKERADLEAAIVEHGRQPLLLLSLAQACKYDGDDSACATLASEALATAPESALITAGSLRLLFAANRSDEALKAFGEATKEVRDDPGVRGIAGQICRHWGLFASAVEAFGGPTLKVARQRRTRRECWWRSGGPLRGLRSSLLNAERTAQSSWPLPEAQTEALEALSLPPEDDRMVRGDLAYYRMKLVDRTTLSPAVVQRWLQSVLAPVIATFAVATLIAGVLVRWQAYAFWSQAAPIAAVTGALGVAWLLARRWYWPAVARMALAAGSIAAGVFLLGLSGPWPFVVGVGLATLALGLIIDEVAKEIPRWRLARLHRVQPDDAVLSDLLDLIGAITTSSRRRELSVRRQWLRELEAAAITLERYVSRGLGGSDADPEEAIAVRFHGLVARIRALKSSIALASESSWDHIIAELRAHAAAVAQGDLGSWPVPAQETTVTAARPRSWWSRATLITRTVLVIFGPPLVAFLLPRVISLHGSGIAWLQIVTLVWALLGCIVALDPKLIERITQMRAVLSLFRDATPPAGQPEAIDPASAVGRPASSRHGQAIRTPATYQRKSRRPGPRDPS
jgi:tetratricopeptide (TPR) repeat protein